jgi:hypothetical protein
VRAFARGVAVEDAFRWNLRDTFDAGWWPQGIDIAEHARGRVIVLLGDPVRDAGVGVRLEPVVR